MIVYGVTASFGSYDDYYQCSLGIFDTLEKANEIKKSFELGKEIIETKYRKRHEELDKKYSTFLDEIDEDKISPEQTEYFELCDKLSLVNEFNSIVIEEYKLNEIIYEDHDFFKATKGEF